jgi:pimeloyl-ACP methyl ester carboxylesterase
MHRSRHARLALTVIAAVVVVACGPGQAVPSPSVAPSPGVSSPGEPPATPDATVVASATPAPTADASGTLDAMIDAGDGRGVHVLCRGSAPPGVPTLLLESGLDGSLHNWAAIQGPLLRLTRVCGYDRAGLGRSDPPPPGTRTVDDLADDLEAVIDGARIEGPFVLVAHSLGPWISTVLTARRPDDVAGLVLVDPRGPRVTAEHLAALGDPVAGEDELVTEIRDFLADEGYDDNAERVAFAPSEAVVDALLAADGPFFGDRPMVVLGAAATIDQFPALPEPVRDAWWSAWVAEQERYASESTAGSFASVPGSGHLMMDDRPRAVIDAVTDVLARARTP